MSNGAGTATAADFRESPGGPPLEAVIETLGAQGVRWAVAGQRPEKLDGGLLTGNLGTNHVRTPTG